MEKLIAIWLFDMILAMFHGVFWFMIIGWGTKDGATKADVDGMAETAMIFAVLFGSIIWLGTTFGALKG